MRVITIWDDRYHCPEAAEWLSTRKQIDVVAAARAENLLEERQDPGFDAERVWDSITSVHDPAYVRAVRTGEPRRSAESQGFNWSAGYADSVSRIWSGHLAACRLAVETRGRVFHPASGAHHAEFNRGGGFCTFNYLAGAASDLLDSRSAQRVMIVDLDTHQGNGTDRLVRDDERIACFDISGARYGVKEREEPRAFYVVVGDARSYEASLRKLPAFVDAFRPEFVQYQAGMDCHETDSLGGVPGMNAERLAERDRFVFDLFAERNIPMVFNLAGGYQENGLTVKLHVETVRIAAR